MNDEGRVLEENLPDVPHLQGPDRVDLAPGRGRGAGVASCSSSTTGSSTAGWPATSTSSCSTPSTRSASAGSSRGACSASRSGRCGGPGWSSSRGPTWSPRPTRRAIRARGRARGRAAPLGRRAACAARPDRRRRAGAEPARSTWPSRPVAAFCGIGNPEGFRRTLEGARRRRSSGSGPSPTIILIRRPTWPTWPPGPAASGPIWP